MWCSPQKMFDKLEACRCLPESPTDGSLDKLPACRTLRGALFILSVRRDRHEGSSAKGKANVLGAPRFSFFHDVATRDEGSQENNHVSAEFIPQ